MAFDSGSALTDKMLCFVKNSQECASTLLNSVRQFHWDVLIKVKRCAGSLRKTGCAKHSQTFFCMHLTAQAMPHLDCCVILLVEVVGYSQADPILAIGGLQMKQGPSCLNISSELSGLDLHSQHHVNARYKRHFSRTRFLACAGITNSPDRASVRA